MQTTYRLKASELNHKILDGIKAVYGDQEIEIIIHEIEVWQDWDQQIEEDSKEGNLDFLIEEALNAKEGNQLREL